MLMQEEFNFKVTLKSYQYFDKYTILDAIQEWMDVYAEDEVIVRVEEMEE